MWGCEDICSECTPGDHRVLQGHACTHLRKACLAWRPRAAPCCHGSACPTSAAAARRGRPAGCSCGRTSLPTDAPLVAHNQPLALTLLIQRVGCRAGRQGQAGRGRWIRAGQRAGQAGQVGRQGMGRRGMQACRGHSWLRQRMGGPRAARVQCPHPLPHPAQSPLYCCTGSPLYCGMGGCGVMSIRGSAISPLWLASIRELRGMTVVASRISTSTSTCGSRYQAEKTDSSQRRRQGRHQLGMALAGQGRLRAPAGVEQASRQRSAGSWQISSAHLHLPTPATCPAHPPTFSRLGCTESTVPTGTPRMRTGVPTVMPQATGNSRIAW